MQAFNTSVAQVKLWLELGDLDGARKALDRVWTLTNGIKSRRTIAHALGNEIQGAIFNEYLKGN